MTKSNAGGIVLTTQSHTDEFLAAIKNRRSIYAISKESPISDSRIEEIVGEAVKYTPSSFNIQSSRVVVLFGEQHNKLWDIVKETLRKIVTGDFSQTEQKIDSFRAGYGSILYFEDQKVIEGIQAQFALYKDNFPVWSEQTSGMLQFIIWTAFANEGLGASLQHYNPLIDDEVKQTWSIPKEWKLISQMPFGKKAGEPGEKQFQPLEERIRFIK